MFGYATNETSSYLPLSIHLAHRLAEQLTTVRQSHLLDYLLPDGKTQVTIKNNDDGSVSVNTIVLSTQHKASIDQATLKSDIITHIIKPVLGDYRHDDITFHINPTGLFTIGGPTGDCGLTGRKIIIDTYGGIGRHGGGAFSGKDPTKVDRSGAYIARYLAKNIVAAGLCDRCEIQLSYAIGVAQPLSIFLECFGTERVTISTILETISKNFDLSPLGIITKLDLRHQEYIKTTAF
jgi:S-adenosylmethionine synthetase